MTYSATAKAAELISQSAEQDTVTHASYSPQLAHILATECDDRTEYSDGHRDVWEFWGTDDDGAEWRVHLERDNDDETA